MLVFLLGAQTPQQRPYAPTVQSLQKEIEALNQKVATLEKTVLQLQENQQFRFRPLRVKPNAVPPEQK